MKKIILMLSVFSLIISSCSKNDDTPKQIRLKTYTHDYYTRTSPKAVDKYTIEYNRSNKISKINLESNGTLSGIIYCVYAASDVLDSIVVRNASGVLSYYYKITWTGNKISKYGDTQLTYNSNGLIDKKLYADGSYYRNEYIGDSVLSYYKPVSGSEVISARYKLSSSIKNPFSITGFEAEACITDILFYYNNGANALLPNIETAEISYTSGNLYDQLTYTFEGDFNGYPLKRSSTTNLIEGNKSMETYTYEEF